MKWYDKPLTDKQLVRLFMYMIVAFWIAGYIIITVWPLVVKP